MSRKHDADKVIVYERGGLVFAFNFHPAQSFTDYRIGVHEPGMYPLFVTRLTIVLLFIYRFVTVLLPCCVLRMSACDSGSH